MSSIQNGKGVFFDQFGRDQGPGNLNDLGAFELTLNSALYQVDSGVSDSILPLSSAIDSSQQADDMAESFYHLGLHYVDRIGKNNLSFSPKAQEADEKLLKIIYALFGLVDQYGNDTVLDWLVEFWSQLDVNSESFSEIEERFLDLINQEELPLLGRLTGENKLEEHTDAKEITWKLQIHLWITIQKYGELPRAQELLAAFGDLGFDPDTVA